MRSRLLLALAAATCLAAIDCGSDSSAVTTADNDGGVAEGGGGNDGGPSTDGAPLGDAASGTIDVNGMLGTGGSPPPPLANRALAIIDATGAVFKTTSAADGTFHVAGVTTPYDVLVTYESPDGGAKVYPFYVGGLTRPDPVVYGMPTDLGTQTDPPTRAASINFTANACAGCTIWVSWRGNGFNKVGTGVSQAYTDSYHWYSTSLTQVTTLHFYFQDATGELTGYKDKTVTLTDGAAADLGTISPSPIPTNPTLAVNATLPSGYTYEQTSLTFYDADRSRIAYVKPATTSSSTTKIPALAGVEIYMESRATGPGSSESIASVTWPDYTAVPNTLPIALPEAPALLGPPDKATGITSTQKLTWTPWTLNRYYTIEIGEENGLYLRAQTTTPEIDLARLAKAGLTLASGHVYSWHYYADTTRASTDDVTKPGGPPAQAQGTVIYTTKGPDVSFTMQ